MNKLRIITSHLLAILFYTCIAFVLAAIENILTGHDSIETYYFELFVICLSISASIYCINTFFVTFNFLNVNPIKRSLFILVDVLLSTLLGLIVAQIILLIFISDQYFFMGSIDVYIGSSIIAIIISTVAFTYYILQERITMAQETLHKAEKEKMQLERMKAEAELELVQGKLNPHFLFNSLNNIASLIRINPEDAEAMTLKLAELFRALIDSDLRSFHSIEDEFLLLKSYLEIEKIRFGKRLEFSLNNEVSDEVEIPKLILQPLVENAIKYAIAPTKETGFIHVYAEKKSDKLLLKVSDSGPGFELSETSGYGLKHIKDRLELLYHAGYSITTNLADQFSITLSIKLR